MDTQTARRCARTLEPIHSMIYFAPEAEDRFAEAGLSKGRMSYFAGRAAPMGPVGPGVVTATFYNFSPDLITRHIPRAWSLADHAELVRLRFDAADAALRRLLGEETVASADVEEAAGLAREATEGCSAEGRSLYAGHADLTWPQEPHLVLWHAASLLREFRGDGHLMALQSAGLTGLEALLTHTATGKGFVEEFAQVSRGWTSEQWSAAAARLRASDILDGSGALTEKGSAVRQQVEAETDRLDRAPWEHLGEEKTQRLTELSRPLARRLADTFPSGVFARR